MPVRRAIDAQNPQEAPVPQRMHIPAISIGKIILVSLLVLLVVGIVDRIEKKEEMDKAELDRWGNCLESYVSSISSARGKKEKSDDQRRCEENLEHLKKGFTKISLVDIVVMALQEMGPTYGTAAILIITLMNLI